MKPTSRARLPLALLLGVWACASNIQPSSPDEPTSSTAAASTALSCQALDVAARGDTTYAIRPDGTVWGWGANAPPYPLGYTAADSRYPAFGAKVATPVQILGVSALPVTALKLAAGKNGACALLGNGTVSCWGQVLGAPGQTMPIAGGAGQEPPPPSPVLTTSGGTPLQNVVAIAMGDAHACALVSVSGAGSAWCWGDDSFGQLGAAGYGPTGVSSSTAAVPMAGNAGGAPLADVIQIAAAGNTTCVLRSGGQISCTGSSLMGQLGQGYSGSTLPDGGDLPGEYLAPVTLSGPSASTTFVSLNGGGGLGDATDGATAAASYGGTFCASAAAAEGRQTTYCWGDNTQGQADLLPSTGTDSVTPTGNSPTANIGSLWEEGAFNGCEVTAAGSVTCWGNNAVGQVSPTQSSSAVVQDTVVSIPAAFEATALVTKVAIGRAHFCALATSGLYCWGDDNAGQLGGGALGPAAPAGAPNDVRLAVAAPSCSGHCGTFTNACGESRDCGACADGYSCSASVCRPTIVQKCTSPAACCRAEGGYWNGHICQ